MIFGSAVGICVAIGLLFNFLMIGQSFGRMDMTEDKIYTISAASKSIIADAEDTIQVNLYITPKDRMPTGMKDLEQNVSVSSISSRFHNTLAQVILSIAGKARKEHNIDTVVLVGGVFLNKKLLSRATAILKNKGFNVLRPINYSPNDESLSIGQIAYALNKIKNDSRSAA